MGRARLLLGAGLVAAGLGVSAFALALPAKAALSQVLLARAFEVSRQTGAPVKAWPWADTWPVARLIAPDHGKTQVVLAGAFGEAMAFGPAHVSATPMPGRPGVSVIAAHRDTHFSFLKDLAPGDAVTVENADGGADTFTVTHTEVVRFDASGIEPDGGPARLALVTCYPFGAVTPGPLRYVVWAKKAAA